MARNETAPYAAEFISYLRAPSKEALVRFDRKIQGLIGNGNLIVVEFYNAEALKVAEVIKPGAVAIERGLPKHGAEFALATSIICEKITLDHNIFLRIFLPLSDGSGRKFGYLESIYQAPEEIVAQNKSQTFWVLILVVLIIFVTSLALYPLIIRLNRKLLDYSHTLTLTNVGTSMSAKWKRCLRRMRWPRRMTEHQELTGSRLRTSKRSL